MAKGNKPAYVVRAKTGRQDAVRMPILYKWISGKCTICATHGDDGNFAIERHPRFEDRSRAGDRLPGGVDVVFAAQPELPFAVVAESPRFEHAGPAQFAGCGVELVELTAWPSHSSTGSRLKGAGGGTSSASSCAAFAAAWLG